jgi:hypothetical protein
MKKEKVIRDKERVNVEINGENQVGIYDTDTGTVTTTDGEVDPDDVDNIVHFPS